MPHPQTTLTLRIKSLELESVPLATSQPGRVEMNTYRRRRDRSTLQISLPLTDGSLLVISPAFKGRWWKLIIYLHPGLILPTYYPCNMAPPHIFNPHSAHWFLLVHLPPCTGQTCREVSYLREHYGTFLLFNSSSRAPLVSSHINPPAVYAQQGFSCFQLLSYLPAAFRVLRSHMWPVASALDSRVEHFQHCRMFYFIALLSDI